MYIKKTKLIRRLPVFATLTAAVAYGAVSVAVAFATKSPKIFEITNNRDLLDGIDLGGTRDVKWGSYNKFVKGSVVNITSINELLFGEDYDSNQLPNLPIETKIELDANGFLPPSQELAQSITLPLKISLGEGEDYAAVTRSLSINVHEKLDKDFQEENKEKLSRIPWKLSANDLNELTFNEFDDFVKNIHKWGSSEEYINKLIADKNKEVKPEDFPKGVKIRVNMGNLPLGRISNRAQGTRDAPLQLGLTFSLGDRPSRIAEESIWFTLQIEGDKSLQTNMNLHERQEKLNVLFMTPDASPDTSTVINSYASPQGQEITVGQNGEHLNVIGNFYKTIPEGTMESDQFLNCITPLLEIIQGAPDVQNPGIYKFGGEKLHLDKQKLSNYTFDYLGFSKEFPVDSKLGPTYFSAKFRVIDKDPNPAILYLSIQFRTDIGLDDINREITQSIKI